MVGWKIYNIVHKRAKGTFYGAFATTEECNDFLKFKKEEHFFNTGNLIEADELWNPNNFIFDYGFSLDRNTIATTFIDVDFSEWK